MASMSRQRAAAPGLGTYLKHAFTNQWNLLLFMGLAAAAALSPWPDALLPLVGAAEFSYLAALVAQPKFRRAVDASEHKALRGTAEPPLRPQALSLETLVERLSANNRERFFALRERCRTMRGLAAGVGARTPVVSTTTNPGLDRLLWVFLRLLYSETSLAAFLATTDGDNLESELAEAQADLAEAERVGDERIVRALRDTVATRTLRLDNFQKARQNGQFVGVELNRLEDKIRTLSEMAVNRQDPDFISREVDSVAESMQQTEAAMSELQLVAGLMDGLADPPVILDEQELLDEG